MPRINPPVAPSDRPNLHHPNSDQVFLSQHTFHDDGSRQAVLMCGILFSVSQHATVLPDEIALVALKARGPDSFQVVSTVIQTHDGNCAHKFFLSFASSVLALRGGVIQAQPLKDESTGSMLCWNGEAWKLGDQRVTGNDSVDVFSALLAASSFASDSSTQVAEVLTKISGPFAFVYFDALSSRIYFGRDRLGRRSLLIDTSDKSSLTLASTGVSGTAHAFSEIPTDRIHCLSFHSNTYSVGDIAWTTVLPTLNKALPTAYPIPLPSEDSVKDLHSALRAAIEVRVVDIPDHSHSELAQGSTKVAILFSGGLDCTLLARIAHEVLPSNEPIDLLNVAFENPRTIAAQTDQLGSPFEICPDRITGRSSFAELCAVCPGRNWRFVSINVPYSEVLEQKPAIIRLMSPHNTEMDLSIAMALYFAASGRGQICQHLPDSCPVMQPQGTYTSTARVLLSGLGADELYGGYTRHSVAFGRNGFAALADELALDFARIGSRNLGRDDRMMSHWGKEVRYPFLDEDFVKFSLSLPVWEKCGFRPGAKMASRPEEFHAAEKPDELDPTKLLLRLVLWNLGMKIAATERKRAIQFGARTAKMEVGKGRKKGTDALSTD